jgi:hypothetical protein
MIEPKADAAVRPPDKSVAPADKSTGVVLATIPAVATPPAVAAAAAVPALTAEDEAKANIAVSTISVALYNSF